MHEYAPPTITDLGGLNELTLANACPGVFDRNFSAGTPSHEATCS